MPSLAFAAPHGVNRTKGCAESRRAPTHECSAMPCARLRACAIWARARVVACVCVPCGAYEVACHRCARAAGWRVWMHTCAYTKPSVQGRSSSTSEWSWATTTVRWPRPCHAGSSTWHAPRTMHCTATIRQRNNGPQTTWYARSMPRSLRDLRVRLVPTSVAVRAPLCKCCRCCCCCCGGGGCMRLAAHAHAIGNVQHVTCSTQQRTSGSMQQHAALLHAT